MCTCGFELNLPSVTLVCMYECSRDYQHPCQNNECSKGCQTAMHVRIINVLKVLSITCENNECSKVISKTCQNNECSKGYQQYMSEIVQSFLLQLVLLCYSVIHIKL